jgi:hypothetical protein
MEKQERNEIISIIPQLMWIIIAAVAIFVFHGQISDLLARSKKLKIGDLEVEAEVAFKRSIDKLPKDFNKEATPSQASRLQSKWERLQEDGLGAKRILIAHARYPEARPIQDALHELGIEADIALCPSDIEITLKKYRYDAVVSNIKWENCLDTSQKTSSGINFLNYAVDGGFSRPTVFFIADLDPKLGSPPQSYGISNNWYELLDMLLGVLLQKSTTPATQ